MQYYTGFDLHANNNYVGIIDEEGKKVKRKRLQNNPASVLEYLEAYKSNMVGVVVESTFNWYWLVDALMDADYHVHLANTAAVQKYNGLKYSNDEDDAFWLAEMLRLKLKETTAS